MKVVATPLSLRSGLAEKDQKHTDLCSKLKYERASRSGVNPRMFLWVSTQHTVFAMQYVHIPIGLTGRS